MFFRIHSCACMRVGIYVCALQFVAHSIKLQLLTRAPLLAIMMAATTDLVMAQLEIATSAVARANTAAAKVTAEHDASKALVSSKRCSTAMTTALASLKKVNYR